MPASSSSCELGCAGMRLAVSKDVTALAKIVTKRIRGMRLCSEGGEGRITHLVLGAERRTLKLLLAVAHGAHLLSPSWLTASQAAGQWLPPAPFTAQVSTFPSLDPSLPYVNHCRLGRALLSVICSATSLAPFVAPRGACVHAKSKYFLLKSCWISLRILAAWSLGAWGLYVG